MADHKNSDSRAAGAIHDEKAVNSCSDNDSRCETATNYLIVGAGRSGVAAAKLIESLGEEYAMFDGNEDLDTDAVKAAIGTENDIRFFLGKVGEDELKSFSVCVTSPGVSINSPILKDVAAAGIPIWSEIELAFLCDKGTVLAITGTNGKTTTTSLTYDIIKAWNENTLLVGNIEIPYAGLVGESVPGGYTVAEISSFQLETMVSFRPHVSAILNITPDHLDRHGSMENYENIKKSITKNQTTDDFVVLNYEDNVLRKFGENDAPCKVVFFSSARPLESGWFLRGDDIILSEDGGETLLVKMSETKLVGAHNAENIMAAAAIAYSAGVPLDIIRSTVIDFTAVEHRIEFTAEINGVKYYNDSKGTNTDAAIKAIDAMPSSTVLIAGGYDKHSEYADWISHLHGKCKKLLLMGQTAEKIAAACDKAGFKDYEFVDDMPSAVKRCAEIAESGDCVLLSPACASWGMFKNYQQRGEIFKACVRDLK